MSRTAHALALLAVGGLVATPLLVSGPSRPVITEPAALGAQRLADADRARALLQAMRGAAAVPCEMTVHTLDVHFGWRDGARSPDANQAAAELVHWATQRVRDPEAVPVLLEGLQDPDACVRRVAARLLGRMRTPEAVAELVGVLASGDPGQRAAAAVGLGHAEQRETVPPLVQALRDDAPSVRAAAAWALGEIESRDAVAPLLLALQNDTDPRVRRAAAWALGEMH